MSKISVEDWQCMHWAICTATGLPREVAGEAVGKAVSAVAAGDLVVQDVWDSRLWRYVALRLNEVTGLRFGSATDGCIE